MAPRFFRLLSLLRKDDTPPDRAIFVLEGIQESLNAIRGTMASFEFPETGPGDPDQHNRINVIEAKLADLTTALDLGVSRVQRSENRIRAIVQGARKELADAGLEHPGIEAEAGQLRELDGGDGKPEPVPAVPVDVEDDYAPSTIPGLTVGEFRRAYSRRR